MTTILVTGAGGFVGQYLVSACLQSMPDWSMHAWYFHKSINFPNSIETAHVDLLDFNLVKNELERIQPTVIIHLAGQANIAKSFVEPVMTFQQNTQTTLNLLEACRLVSPRTTFFLVSSGDVYGEASSRGLLTEETQVEPLNFYSTSKHCAEKVAEGYYRDFGLKTIILRPFNHVGVGQLPSSAISQFAEQIAKIERGDMPPILSVGNIQVERDILNVKDVVFAYIELMKIHVELEGASIVNICSGASQSIATVLQKLLALSKVAIEVKVDPNKLRSNDIRIVAASNQKLKTLCPHWSAQHDLTETLQAILQSYRSLSCPKSEV